MILSQKGLLEARSLRDVKVHSRMLAWAKSLTLGWAPTHT